MTLEGDADLSPWALEYLAADAATAAERQQAANPEQEKRFWAPTGIKLDAAGTYRVTGALSNVGTITVPTGNNVIFEVDGIASSTGKIQVQGTGTLEAQTRAETAERIVRQYARRAIVGAMAAVAPGSDLVIQGVLATGLTRALAELYGVKLSEVQIEDFVRQARLTLRTGSSIVLAVAGNALKAFPGLGTLGGGVLHAFAYALIFDSMGRALAASLAERQTLDQDDADARLKTLLADAGSTRLRQLATLTMDTLREPRGE